MWKAESGIVSLGPGVGRARQDTLVEGNRALGVAIDCALRFIMLERQQDFAPERGMLLYLASPGTNTCPANSLRAVLTSAASRTTVLPPARPR